MDPILDILKVKLLTKTAILPRRAHSKDSGLDLFYDGEPITLAPGSRRLLSTGIAILLPRKVITIDGMPLVYEAQIRPRSGMALKQGFSIVNSPGSIDNEYVGHIQVIGINTNSLHGDGNGQSQWPHQNNITINPGDKIAQLVVSLVALPPVVVEVDDLEDTERGAAGFGSTGTR